MFRPKVYRLKRDRDQTHQRGRQYRGRQVVDNSKVAELRAAGENGFHGRTRPLLRVLEEIALGAGARRAEPEVAYVGTNVRRPRASLARLVGRLEHGCNGLYLVR